MEKEHTIWNNTDLCLDDWRDDLLADYPDYSEDELWRAMVDTNDLYLEDERRNLAVPVGGSLVILADLGLWNGRRFGFKVIPDATAADILYSNCDYCRWYVDEEDVRFTGHHHDGTNHYLYRVYEGDPADLYDMTQEEMLHATKSLRPVVAAVYGW
jgi:hypothetical protein